MEAGGSSKKRARLADTPVHKETRVFETPDDAHVGEDCGTGTNTTTTIPFSSTALPEPASKLEGGDARSVVPTVIPRHRILMLPPCSGSHRAGSCTKHHHNVYEHECVAVMPFHPPFLANVSCDPANRLVARPLCDVS
jgi:hypothetical protein